MDTICSLILSFRVLVVLTEIFIPCCCCVPSLRRGHKSKKRNTDATDLTRIGLFTDSFFWFNLGNDSWIPLWIYLDLRVFTHSLSWWYQCYYSAYWLQPPPSLTRRGGTNTIGYMIFVSNRLIINGLSVAIVTVPPLRGEARWGLEWLCCAVGLEVNIRSNLFLPFGKVRMGLRLGGGWCQYSE